MSKLLSAILISTLFIGISQAKTGEEIYNQYCIACHTETVAKILGSPVAHNKEDWQPHIDEALEEAIAKDASIANASEDKQQAAIIEQILIEIKAGTAKGMPRKGTCMKCSDEELKRAIEFMIE